MDVLYGKYVNIQKFITEYRKYTVKGEFLDFKSFKKHMQIDQYIKHTCAKNGRPIYIFMFKVGSIYAQTTQQFRRLLNKLPEDRADVIVISKNTLSTHINKSLLKYPHLTVFNYRHMIFNIEISLGPLCSPHRIMPKNEVLHLCNNVLHVHPLSLSAIPIDDPQNVWVGGNLGDVIEIISISEIAGRVVRYRIVSPSSGKSTNIRTIHQAIIDDTKKNILDEPNDISLIIDEDTSDLEEE